jgi:cell wall-associated NlpC family hydrolase
MRNGIRVRLSVTTAMVTLGMSASTAVASPASKQADLGKRAAAAALTQLGKPYVWGQESPATGFDGSMVTGTSASISGASASSTHHTSTQSCA